MDTITILKMKILIFSDTHLNGKFEEKKARFLKRIITGADRVIINGDFWDGWRINFSQFLDSPWKELFPLLRKKHTVYIYGNHDTEGMSDTRASIFSSMKANSWEMSIDGKTFSFEHGHRLSGTADKNFRLAKYQNAARYLLEKWDSLEERLVRNYGKGYLKYFWGVINPKMKWEMRKRYPDSNYLFCGHSHLAEADNKSGFYNTGLIRYGLGQYIVVEDSKISPKEEWYEK